MKLLCPVCGSSSVNPFRRVKEYDYFKCLKCEVLFLSPDLLAKIDEGFGLIQYSNTYWQEELAAARQRSWGPALARVAELFLYARLPIRKCIDIGSGPGYLLDALQHQLPSSGHIFFAHELFPPERQYCTTNPNYVTGNLSTLDFQFDAGTCIEVIEHLTPLMVKNLFADLARKSNPNSIYLFNTGLSLYIEKEDINYLDPYVRGHIMGWSVKGVAALVQHLGFNITAIPGKTWAFIAEYRPNHGFDRTLTDRIWHALPENVNTLRDKQTGDVMYVLGLDTARAYS
jgi:hypothetical protein